VTIIRRTSCAVVERALLVSTFIVCAGVALLVGAPRSAASVDDEGVSASDDSADGIARDGLAPVADAVATDPFARCAEDDESFDGLDEVIADLPCATASIDEAWERIGYQSHPWFSVRAPRHTPRSPSSHSTRLTRVQRRRRRQKLSQTDYERTTGEFVTLLAPSADACTQPLVTPESHSTSADAPDTLSGRAPPR
jgi:hypothetical protein